MYTLEEQKNNFNEKVNSEEEKKGKNTRLLSKQRYIDTLLQLKQLETFSFIGYLYMHGWSFFSSTFIILLSEVKVSA